MINGHHTKHMLQFKKFDRIFTCHDIAVKDQKLPLVISSTRLLFSSSRSFKIFFSYPEVFEITTLYRKTTDRLVHKQSEVDSFPGRDER